MKNRLGVLILIIKSGIPVSYYMQSLMQSAIPIDQYMINVVFFLFKSDTSFILLVSTIFLGTIGYALGTSNKINDTEKSFSNIVNPKAETDISQLQELKKLYDEGVLTDSEFEKEKQKVLNQ